MALISVYLKHTAERFSYMDSKTLQAYRTKNYRDLYSGIIPDRFPVNEGISVEYAIQYAGKDLLTTQYQYSTELIIEIMEKVMEIAKGDNFGLAWARNPVALMFSQSANLTMGNTGFIQHPEVSSFEADEYDEYIKNPHEFTIGVIGQRINKGYAKDPATFAFNFVKNYLASRDVNGYFAEANAYIREKYGLFAPPPGTEGFTAPPFDTIADFNRGFTNITVDIKRRPQKVLDAMEALMPQAIYNQSKSRVDILGSSRIMTHMGVFLNQKDFDKFYWPTFYKLCHIAGERSQRMHIFCEGDWTRFIDNMYELPAGTRLWIEYGDARKYKDKLGNKHILGGLYPLTLLKSGTTQQCIDKAKELIDILAAGGNFFFDFDKHTLHENDINPKNYAAVLEYCVENGKYDNAGQKSTNFVFEDTVQKFSHLYPEFKSKYIVTFEDYLKENPAVDGRVIPYMRDAYNKYNAMVPPML